MRLLRAAALALVVAPALASSNAVPRAEHERALERCQAVALNALQIMRRAGSSVSGNDAERYRSITYREQYDRIEAACRP